MEFVTISSSAENVVVKNSGIESNNVRRTCPD